MYRKIETGQDLLEFLETFSEEDLKKKIIVYNNREGNYIDYVYDCGTKGKDIVIGYNT